MIYILNILFRAKVLPKKKKNKKQVWVFTAQKPIFETYCWVKRKGCFIQEADKHPKPPPKSLTKQKSFKGEESESSGN